MRRDARSTDSPSTDGRREFLRSCGRFALITPPAMTLLLSSGGRNFAAAGSGLSGGGSLPSGGGTTYFVPRDDALIQEAGGVKPGDTVCFSGPGGINCKSVNAPPN